MSSPDVKRMHFTRMDQGTDKDFEILREVHVRNLAALPDVLFGMLADLSADAAYNLNRRDHSLQTATRALRDGADEELVVVALFHDVGESLGPMNHGEVAAAILRPFISDDNHWLLGHHPLFQTHFYAQHLGLDPNARDQFKGAPAYQKTVDFCARWDEVSFDPDYPNEPLATFVPMVHQVLSKPWQPPGA